MLSGRVFVYKCLGSIGGLAVAANHGMSICGARPKARCCFQKLCGTSPKEPELMARKLLAVTALGLGYFPDLGKLP